ncbi:MAG: ribosome-associated translation inhibitor RaiA [Candidatus Paceibacterota bacterium]|jgi:ribosomal subunit interface protein
MNINIKTTSITLTPAISEYVAKRLDKIGKLLGNDPSIQCDVELARTTEHHQKGNIFRAEIHIVGSAKNAYASSEETDLYSAIDTVRDEILQEIRVGKGKKISLIRRSGARLKNMVKGLWSWRRSKSL